MSDQELEKSAQEPEEAQDDQKEALVYNDREIDDYSDEVPEIPEELERVLLYALEEGKKLVLKKETLVPFTCLCVKESLFIESHPGDSAEDCYALARHTVEGARGATCYAFCYDGYVDTDAGMLDCIIAEGGIPGEEDAYAVGYVYETDQESGIVVFEEEAGYIGLAPNFMEKLKQSDEYSYEEIDRRYSEGEGFEDGGEVIVEV